MAIWNWLLDAPIFLQVPIGIVLFFIGLFLIFASFLTVIQISECFFFLDFEITKSRVTLKAAEEDGAPSEIIAEARRKLLQARIRHAGINALAVFGLFFFIIALAVFFEKFGS